MHDQLKSALRNLGVENHSAVMIGSEAVVGTGQQHRVRSPIDGEVIAELPVASAAQMEKAVTSAAAAFHPWRTVPAPRRGELVRRFGDQLRRAKADLATIVSFEAGKIRQESLGEVQEMIDICEFAVGLSRQLYGKSIASERPAHRLTEQWHPLGPVGVISAFNFPVAVWAWNAAIALVCGDPVVWKPSEKTPLCALAVEQALASGASPDEAAQRADMQTEPPSDLNASAEYRRHLAKVLVRRALEESYSADPV